MKNISGKELIKVLKKRGWQLTRVHGSHHIFIKEGLNIRLCVPVHGNKPLKIGLLKHLLKMARINFDYENN